jgi:hypothetical protein
VLEQEVAQMAAMLPVWAVVVLIWWAGVSMTAIAALILRAINARNLELRFAQVDKDITGARTALQEIIDSNDRRYAGIRQHTDQANDDNFNRLNNAMFGLDGDNGVRGDVRVTRRQVGNVITVLRRLGETAGVDVSELSAE